MSSENPTTHQAPKLSASQRAAKQLTEERDQFQHHARQLLQTNNQLLRILWLTINLVGGKVTLDIGKLPVLWEIKKLAKESETEISFEAAVLPELTDEQIKTCAQWLIEKQVRLEEAAAEFKFEGYPLPYIELRLHLYAEYSPESGWRATELK